VLDGSTEGASVCANSLPVRREDANAAVVEVVEKMLSDSVLDRALDYACNVLDDDRSAEKRETMTKRLATLDKECGNLAKALARGGELDALLDELRTREAERTTLKKRLGALDANDRRFSRTALRSKLAVYLRDLKTALTSDVVAQAQAVLKMLVAGRLAFAPQTDGSYRFTGTGTVEPVVAGLVPTCTERGVPNGMRHL
jgi:hypothetical protein